MKFFNGLLAGMGIVAIMFVLLAPLVVFWAANTIVPSLNIEYSFMNYVAFQIGRMALSAKFTFSSK